MMRPLSIRASLTAWFVGLTTVLLVAFSATLYGSIRKALHTGLDARLETAAHGLAALCGWEEDGWYAEFELSEEFARQLTASEPTRSREVWTWPEGRRLHRSGEPIDLPVPGFSWAGDLRLNVDTKQEYGELEGSNGARRLITMLAVSPRVPATLDEPEQPAFTVLVRVAEDLAPIQAQLARIGWIIAVLAGVAAGVVVVFAVLLSRRVVRPLRELGQAASEIRAGRAAQLPHRGVGDEVDELGDHLEEAFSRLEDALERQTRFTSDAAHELRNPISVIQNASEIALRRQRSDQDYREFLGDVFATSQHMGRVVEALLLLARLDAGTASASFKKVDLADVARDSVAAQPSGADRVSLSNGSPAVVKGDDALLRVLVDNLVANALRHSGEDARVQVSVQNGDGVTLRVADEGPGIPPEHVGRVFDRFYRVASSHPHAPGAGLGLALVAEVARLHSAEPHIESAPSGTCVVVKFPNPD